MKIHRIVALLGFGLLCCAPAHAIKIERLLGLAGHGGGMEVTAECVLVQFSSGTPVSSRDAARVAVSGVSMVDSVVPGWAIINLASGASVAPALAILSSFPGVARVAPNRVLHLSAYPSDPGVAQQYSLSNTDAFSGWEFGTGSTNKVTVAVIDSGVDFTHPDLQAKKVNSGAIMSQYFSQDAACGTGGHPACRSNDDPVSVACSHGTQVASVAAASTNNGIGIAGVSWGAQLISLRVFDSGCAGTNDTAIANAISYAANTLQDNAAIGKLVVNLSVGGPSACDDLPLTKAALANMVSAKGVPIAIAAGNSSPEPCTLGGNSGVDAPANCAGAAAAYGIVPVGATDAINNVSNFSCRGTELAAHGVAAPGENIQVDTPGGGMAQNSGTSFASPFVAGLMSLMLSYQPTFTPTEIESKLRGGANNIGTLSGGTAGIGSGAGQVNVFRTMRLAVKGTLADFEGDQKAIAFPNPFRTSQTGSVSFTIPLSPQGRDAKIKIYTVAGEFVRELTGLTWNGKNEDGNPVATGTYIFVVSTDKGTTKNRLAVIR